MPDKPGFVDGKHFTEYVETVKRLRSDNRGDEAIALLLRLVDATEAESRSERLGVAPWYYEQLAITYHKAGRLADELAILDRFAGQQHARGASPPTLLARLAKLRAKLQ